MFGLDYASVYSKVKRWSRSLLRDEELDTLTRMELQELLSNVKARTYKIDIQTDNVAEVEGLLKQENYNYIVSGLRFLSGNPKNFMLEWLKQYEVENIKIIVRALLNKKGIDYLYQLSPKSKIKMELIKGIKYLDSFEEFLSGTEYYRLAVDSFPRIQSENNPFYFEMNIDNYFALGLKKKLSTLSGQDKKDAWDILIYYMEIKRILALFRAKFNFNIPPAEAAVILPNIFGMIAEKNYEKLVRSETKENFIIVLKSIGFIRKLASGGESMERELTDLLLKRVRKIMRSTPFRIGVLFGFLVSNHVNIRNLIVLLESRRLKMDMSVARDLML